MRTRLLAFSPTRLLALLLLIAACGRETREAATETAQNIADRVRDAIEVTIPVGKPDDPKAREKERFDREWARLESFRERAAQQARAQGPERPNPPQTFLFVAGTEKGFQKIDPASINAAPIAVPIEGDISGPSVLKAQVWLDRIGFSVGVIDGRWGRNSAIATWWFQRSRGIDATGSADEATLRALAGEAAYADAVAQHRVTADDLEGPFVPIPEDIYEKAKLSCLCYESAIEKIAERFHASAEFLERLNPGVRFGELKAGDVIFVPNVRLKVTADLKDFARVVVSIRGNTFNAYDAAGNLVFHAPTTLGSQYDPSPRETLQVKGIFFNPHFHYQPKLFHEIPDTDPEARLKPGPNSPVGVVWIALTKPHYGIHGTSDPDAIGYASSHGCVRLTNWDAMRLAGMVRPGTKVEFVP